MMVTAADADTPMLTFRVAAVSAFRQTTNMKQTSFDAFVDLARRSTFVPVVKELVADLLTPVSAFLRIAEHSDYAFLLESVEGGEHVGRYSFLGKDPFVMLRARDGKTIVEARGRDDGKSRGVRRRAAQDDGRLQLAVRSGAAAIHGRRRRLSRIRHGRVVRAGHTAERTANPIPR